MTDIVFIEWLREQEALDKFFKNVEQQARRTIEELQIHRASIWVDKAFIWRETPEGHTFWNEIDSLWRSETYRREKEVSFGSLKPKRSVKELR